MFSNSRLEGRALEHALASDGCPGIRMKDRSGVFQIVKTFEAKQVRRCMEERVAKLRDDMVAQELFLGKADCPVTLSSGEERSVDVLVWSSVHQDSVFVEVKWTRRSQTVALKWGSKSLPMLRQACSGGLWSRSRRKVKAIGAGVLVVRPGDWLFELSVGSRLISFPKTVSLQRKRKGGRSLPGNQKRKTNPHLKARDKMWRRTAGREMGRRHQRQYRKSKKGKAKRAKTDQRYYKKRCTQ